MKKKLFIITIAIALSLALSLPSFAASTSQWELNGYNVIDEMILLENSDPNGISPLYSEIPSPTIDLNAGYSVSIGSAGNPYNYFTTQPGNQCVLTFNAGTPNITAVRMTIGGVQYEADYRYCTPTVNGRYEFTFVWTVNTATPYNILITNNSNTTQTLSGFVITY